MTNNSIEGLTVEQQALINEAVNNIHVEIPVNSDTALISETTSRFSSAVWYEEIKKKTIILAGLGGIGSYVNFLLARMQPSSIFIFDDDIVESVNLSGQLYGISDIGQKKVNAAANMVSNYANYNSVFAISERYTEESESSDIMICGFDNMAARATFFKKWYNHVINKPQEERHKCLYLDGRLSAECMQVLCIQGNDDYNIERYQREYLFSDAEADETVCSYKQTTFCANMIASIMVNLFVNFCANIIEGENKPIIPRDLPFYTYYDAEFMHFKTEA